MQPAVRQHYALEELYGEGKFDDVVNSTVPVESRRQARGARSRDEGDGGEAPKPRARRKAARPQPVAKPKPAAKAKPTAKAKPAAKPKAAPKSRAPAKKPRRKAP
jgi:septal ring-binding cell division protein DamX